MAPFGRFDNAIYRYAYCREGDQVLCEAIGKADQTDAVRLKDLEGVRKYDQRKQDLAYGEQRIIYQISFDHRAKLTILAVSVLKTWFSETKKCLLCGVFKSVHHRTYAGYNIEQLYYI